jgi:hypothetical protein
MKQKTMIWTYVAIEALVLIPIVLYAACHKL